MKLGYFMQKTTIKDTFNDRKNFTSPRHNGICVKFYNFWCKNDGEKLSRKNIFEIPPCTHHVIFITEFVLLTKNPFYEVNSFNRKW